MRARDRIPGGQVGNYQLERELGADPLGVAYLATHVLLPRRAAVKVAHTACAERAGGVDRAAVHLLREACMLEALHHPGVPRVFESGLLPDRRAWFAAELVEGPTLGQALRPGAARRAGTVALLRDLASVLEHAHQRGVIHCGLRPSRVVLTARTRESPVCVMDWSDARAHDAGPSSFPITSESWHYTAPELAAGDAVDDRADVFAIGVIAYQLLTGGLPYQHRGLTGGAALAAEHCPSLGALRADLPRELSTLVDQMLSYQRWDRPSSAEVRDGLAWIATALAEAGRAGARIRRPRWTPPLELEPIGDPDRAAAAIGDRADS